VTRSTVAAMAVWAGLVAVWAIFIFGSQVQMCLGPLDVTPESCRVQLGLPPLTDWDRFLMGPGPLIVVTLVGWLAIALVARRRKRQRGGL
jgi:hypothetical protein